MKRISHFLPSARLTAEEAERHYSRVHHPFARAALSRSPLMLRYSTHLALGQLDVTGHFDQRPSLWRFVVTENAEPEPDGGATEWLPASLTQLFWHDHANFLRELCSYEVAESTALDRRTGQTSFAKIILRWQAEDADAGAEDWNQRLPRLLELLDETPGIRLVVSNTVLNQLETLPIHEPAQRFSGGRLGRADVVAFDELWFDNIHAAVQAFSDPATIALVHGTGLRASGFHVAETCGFDRR